jgi:hypothetical protein
MNGLEQIVLSTATCKKCGDVLISRHRHDYVMCTCDNKTMLDGGTEYQRYGGVDLSLIDLSGTIYLTDGFEKCRTAPIWGSYGKNGDEPLKFMSVSEMETEHLEAVIKELGHRVEKWRLDLMLQELENREQLKQPTE